MNRDLRPPNPTKASTHFTIDKNEDTRIGTFLKSFCLQTKSQFILQTDIGLGRRDSLPPSTQCSKNTIQYDI